MEYTSSHLTSTVHIELQESLIYQYSFLIYILQPKNPTKSIM